MLLQIQDLHAYYGESHILQGVSMGVDHDEIVCLLGRNGVGKSTTLKTVMGVIARRTGEIIFAGERISNLPSYRIAGLGIGYVPEERRIFPTLTVRENLLIGMRKDHTGRGPLWTIEKIYEYFPSLRERDQQKGRHLSGGEQQMLTTARTLMGNPKILLIDEPTEGLAPIIVEKVEEMIKEINRKGIPILLVEQKMKVALRLAQRVYVMSKGTIVFQGSNAELEQADNIRSKYLEI